VIAMNKFLYFFNKKYLLILAGLFLVSSLSLQSLYHDEYEIEHSEAECHYCINETLDDFLVDASIENLFLSIYFNSKDLDIFNSKIIKNFYSRAPPKI
jgi:hypothetical protein